ncbi:Pathogenicity locus [Lentibacillus persicus]|uniref:Pathogenicity locus n=1 Tax=Lentibacillus persicus TaxID=640948 RepID=A0A1I1ZD22_9BACI|nr:helix-hairpin-helix domain-containing protein [Lentibacillus persicus]SFE29661.1 Pathogenicity locus [Lentibacillus persicus]
MNGRKNPKLPLTQTERSKLRSSKVKLSEIHNLQLDDLIKILDITNERAKFLIGLSTFQQIPSIGYELAHKLVNLGYYSIDQIKDEEWAELFNRLEVRLGCWTDPCVEDQIICVIHHANNPDSEKQWFDFTRERKEFRQKFGYPKSRPKIPWYDI